MRALVTYLVLAFVCTWALWVPRALASHGLLDAPWVVTLAGFWPYGPLVAALIAAGITGGRAAVRTWAGRLVRWRIGYLPYAVALLGPAVFWLVVAAASVLLLGAPWVDVQPRILEAGPALGLALIGALVLTDGLGEEPGWRGFALPALLDRMRALPASLLLGVVWAVWHLPLLYTRGSALDGSPMLFHLLDLPPTAVLYTWLFLRSQGSVIPAILLHAANNAWTVAAVPTGPWTLLAGALAGKWLLVLAVVVAWRKEAESPLTLRPGRPAAGPGHRSRS